MVAMWITASGRCAGRPPQRPFADVHRVQLDLLRAPGQPRGSIPITWCLRKQSLRHLRASSPAIPDQPFMGDPAASAPRCAPSPDRRIAARLVVLGAVPSNRSGSPYWIESGTGRGRGTTQGSPAIRTPIQFSQFVQVAMVGTASPPPRKAKGRWGSWCVARAGGSRYRSRPASPGPSELGPSPPGRLREDRRRRSDSSSRCACSAVRELAQRAAQTDRNGIRLITSPPSLAQARRLQLQEATTRSPSPRPADAAAVVAHQHRAPSRWMCSRPAQRTWK